MTNEEIIKEYGKPENWISLSDLLDLARADEREKMTEDKFAEYFNTLKGGEVASAILTQLLRKGITDDDLRGLRLQWIKEKPEGVEVWVSWDKHHKWEEVARISLTEPIICAEGNDGAVIYRVKEPFCDFSKDICKSLNLSPGECAKFRIVRVE